MGNKKISSRTRFIAIASVSITCLIAISMLCVKYLREDELYEAIVRDEVSRVDTLLAHGFGRKTLDHELFFARSKGVAESLIRRGADVNGRERLKCTPLHFAAALGASDVVETLILHGSVVDAQDYLGQTPLMWAVTEIRGSDTEFDPTGYTKDVVHEIATANTLLKYGASVNLRDEMGYTPLLHAAWGSDQVVRILLDAGSDPRASSKDGYTPLHLAVCGNLETVRLLLERHADPRAREWQGKRPLDLVTDPDRADKLKLLNR